MLLTYKLKHEQDFSDELKKAFRVAEFAVQNPKCRSSKQVSNIGLPSSVSNQILKKYGNQKTIKKVHNVNLIVPGQGIKYFPETNSIWISCLKLHMENLIPTVFETINQMELDKEYAYISVTVPEKLWMIPQQFIGVDRNTTGHIVVAANPDNRIVRKMGRAALHIHTKYKNVRARLQKVGQYRKVRRIKDKESRVVRDLNHKVSKELVAMAVQQNAALVFEDLAGIRNTNKQNRSFRYSLHSWSFYQLQNFVEYKAKLLGVPVLYVNPSYTSQDCSMCGARGHRIGKQFVCPVCGHVNHADVNAAFNIALRQKDMVTRMQTMMCTMGTLIPHNDALLEGEHH
jgi:putative transposase